MSNSTGNVVEDDAPNPLGMSDDDFLKAGPPGGSTTEEESL